MEKYCNSCGRVLGDVDFILCPYCGNKLNSRVGRQPIPNRLRHAVFQRDQYRCRECGASKEDGVTLEIDHIIPVAKGGTNDISNLQTLCKACNRGKYTDTWVGGKISNGHHSHDIANERRRLAEIKRNKLFDKIFPKITNFHVDTLRYGNSSIGYANKNDIARYLVNNFSENEINQILKSIDDLEIQKEKYTNKYGNTKFFVLGCSDLWYYFYKLSDGTFGRFYADSKNELKQLVLSKDMPWVTFEFESKNNHLQNFVSNIYLKENMGSIEELSLMKFSNLRPKDIRKKVLSHLDPIISGGISHHGYRFCDCGNKIKYYKRYCDDCKPPEELFEPVVKPKPQPKFKKCPNCGAEVRENALRCKYCKTMLK